ncbi:hypothetical protein TNIN_250571 [Trichonephila inaurata madagascariensis]|uniref:Uncharacterized protein n=1 Tax=Trichonephila inaurata madagascariensis TaxID=2747483 RepID=A0A8X6Y2R6_9ARAC|nr:hypothetical protein TNIN_250571 [Trichonephila inaurata madagascariensis]
MEGSKNIKVSIFRYKVNNLSSLFKFFKSRIVKFYINEARYFLSSSGAPPTAPQQKPVAAISPSDVTGHVMSDFFLSRSPALFPCCRRSTPASSGFQL